MAVFYKPKEVFFCKWQPFNSEMLISSFVDWIDSGPVALGDYQGQSIQVGFQYLGSGKITYDGTYELDDIRIIENNP